MMHMSHDSSDFKTYEDLIGDGATINGNVFISPKEKNMFQFMKAK